MGEERKEMKLAVRRGSWLYMRQERCHLWLFLISVFCLPRPLSYGGTVARVADALF